MSDYPTAPQVAFIQSETGEVVLVSELDEYVDRVNDRPSGRQFGRIIWKVNGVREMPDYLEEMQYSFGEYVKSVNWYPTTILPQYV